MRFSFEAPSGLRASAYRVVDTLVDADCTIVNADFKPAVEEIASAGRVAHSLFVGATAPAGAAAHLRRPIDPTRILRALDQLVAEGPVERSARSAAASAVFASTLHDFLEVVPTLEPAPKPSPEPSAAPGATAEATPAAVAHADSLTGEQARITAAKVAARAAARRRRQASAAPMPTSSEPLRDVLVLDADPVTSGQLCQLLECFGFVSRAVTSVDQAQARVERQVFAAAFLSVPFDDAAVELLKLLRTAEHEGTPAQTPVVMVGVRADPASRVRTTLAGLSEPLIKPLSRGDVARALERNGVIFPADARRR